MSQEMKTFESLSRLLDLTSGLTFEREIISGGIATRLRMKRKTDGKPFEVVLATDVEIRKLAYEDPLALDLEALVMDSLEALEEE